LRHTPIPGWSGALPSGILCSMGFDRDGFVAACRDAVDESDVLGAITQVVQRAISDGSAVDAALGTEITGHPDTLFSSSGLTVQRILFPGGSKSAPHDHRMWAVVGVYAGCETNVLYQRQGTRLARRSTAGVDAGQVIAFDEDAIHSVANPSRAWTAGLHVYGGDILNAARSAWQPDGTEVPFEENRRERRAMVEAMRDLAKIHGRTITEADRFAALTALWRETERRQRNLAASDAREVIIAAWEAASP
jgi:predicted metal-dependent enzyme (double-stranded beta helix superfamily)